jgi:protein-tyrosine-phosphatase
MRGVDEEPVMNILFVCGGNTCRNPMAAALAQHGLGLSKARINSAGIAPHGTRATADPCYRVLSASLAGW